PIYLNVMLLLLIAAMIYPAYRSVLLSKERKMLQEPSLSGTVLYAARTERDANVPTIQVHFDQKNRTYNLTFALPPGDFQIFEVDILAGWKDVWHGEISLAGSPPMISVHLRADYFTTGAYVLRISGKKDNTTQVVATYNLAITISGSR